MILFLIIAATVFVSLLSLIGIFFLQVKEDVLKRLTVFLVSLASGSLIGVAFFHLIPESLENSPNTFFYVVLGIVIFFILEKFLYWRHCHNKVCDVHTFTYLNLIGDSIHNFLDGIIIAGSFLTSLPLGFTTTLAVALHEFPQELGDFGILIYGGMRIKKAILYNLLSAISAIVGGVLAYIFISEIEFIKVYLISFAGGGFLYIALVDLIPELKSRVEAKESILQLLFIILGISLMGLLKTFH